MDKSDIRRFTGGDVVMKFRQIVLVKSFRSFETFEHFFQYHWRVGSRTGIFNICKSIQIFLSFPLQLKILTFYLHHYILKFPGLISVTENLKRSFLKCLEWKRSSMVVIWLNFIEIHSLKENVSLLLVCGGKVWKSDFVSINFPFSPFSDDKFLLNFMFT